MTILNEYIGRSGNWVPLAGGSVISPRGPVAESTSRLGLHVSAAELDVWRDRAVNGPYKTFNDHPTSVNNPGDWDRIVSQKDEFVANPFANFASQPASKVLRDQELEGYGGNDPLREYGRTLRSAAFYHLVKSTTEDTSAVAAAVKAWLLEQATGSGRVDYTDRTIWTFGEILDLTPGFGISIWLAQVLYAYEYLRASERAGEATVFTAGERASLDEWFYNAADYWSYDSAANLDSALGTTRWDDPPTYDTAPLNDTHIYLHDGSQTYTAPAISRYYNNRRAHLTLFGSEVGVMLDEDGYAPPSGASPGRSLSWLRKSGKLFVEEYLKFAASPDPSWWGDSDRWRTDLPQLGILYGIAPWYTIGVIADNEARTGNNELFTFSTRYGQHGSSTTFDKTLQWTLEDFQKYVREEHDRYGSDVLANNTDDYKLTMRDPMNNRFRVKDVGIARCLRYFDNSLMASTLRRESGPNAFTASPYEAKYGFEGTSGELPASLFMFEGTGTNPYPTQNLGLLATSAELAMWQGRKDNGPFAVSGDFSNNSPGHWTEMNAAMSLDFTTGRWSGPTWLGEDGRVLKVGDGLSSGLENDPPTSTREMASDMMSAAYAALITNNTTVAENVVAEIVYLATRTNLDYGNRTLWPFDYYDDVNPMFMHCLWVLDLVVAYDACNAQGVVTASQKSTIEGWFLNLAELAENALHGNLSKYYPNRRSDSYDVQNQEVYTGVLRLADGSYSGYPRGMQFYNNRRNDQAALCGLVGALTDTQFYIDEFKRYMREWVMFGNSISASSGSRWHWGDVNRGKDSAPQLGLSYHVNSTSRMLNAVDALARKGDTSVYDFSSSEGTRVAGVGTNHFKSFEDCLDVTMGWVSQSIPAHYTADGEPPPISIADDPFYRVQSRSTATDLELSADSSYLLAANYYNRSDWVNIINRVGTPTGFTNPPWQAGAVTGWRADRRQRFLRSLTANPYGGA